MSEQQFPSLNRRGFLKLGGAAAAMGALAACGSNTGREKTSSSLPPSASDGSPSSGAASPTPGGGNLHAWFHAYGEPGTQEALEKYAAGFNKAKVTVGWFPADYDSKVNSALLTDEAPDVFEYANGPTIDAILGGQVTELDGILGDATKDYPAWLVERLSHGGKLYAVPQLVDMHMLVYRKSVFDAKGIKVPESVDELFAAIAALTEGDTKGAFFGNDGGIGVLIGPMLWSVGADYLTKDNKPGFTDPAVVAAFKKWHELFSSGNLLLGAPKDWSDPSAFTTELVPIQWTGLWTFPDIIKAFGDDFGTLAWPKFNDAGAPSAPVGAYSACISSKSKQVDLAKDFIKYLWVDGTDMQLEFATAFGFHLPARASVAAKADVLKTGAAAQALKIMQENGHAQTPLLWTSASATAMNDAVTKIVKDGADPTAELAGVLKTVEAELARVQK